MKQVIRKNKKWFGYLLYVILLTMAFLYYLFPSDALRDYLQATVGELNPRLILSIEKVSTSFPFGLRFIQTELSPREGADRVLFRADRIFISPKILSFLRGQFRYHFECLAYDGDLRGNIHFIKDNLRTPFTASIEIKDIRIDDNTPLPGVIGRHMQGLLDGTITYSGQNRFLRDGKGKADLKLSEGRVELLQPILSLKSIEFNELWIRLDLDNRKIDLTRVELKGQGIQGTLSGTISVNKEFLKSSLDLRGSIEPFSDFFESLTRNRDAVKFIKQRLKRGKLSFIIRGSINDPRMKFI